MRLLASPTSPYARKVRLVIHALGLNDMVTFEVASPWDDESQLANYNPLRKVPTLVMPNDQALTESHLIIDYFCSINPDINLLPMTVNVWQHVAHMGLADGLMDNTLSVVLERLKRPEAFQYEPWIDRRLSTMDAVLTKLNDDTEPQQHMQLFEISLACALGFLDYRLDSYDWRTKAPKLASWYETFTEHEFMQATHPDKPL